MRPRCSSGRRRRRSTRSACGPAGRKPRSRSNGGCGRRKPSWRGPQITTIRSLTTIFRSHSSSCGRSSRSFSKGTRMLDELKEEGIVNKVGGRFKLSTLIQKRMVALNTGAKPLVDLKTPDRMAVVIQEILQDKIYLDA